MRSARSVSDVVVYRDGWRLGAVSRYGMTLGAARLGATGCPYATLTVNVVGSFLIGLFVAWIGGRTEINPALRPLIQVGFLGALTTFSTFSLDALILLEQ
jgi:CrcB protein